MYKIIEQGTEEDFFSEEVISEFYRKISIEIQEDVEKKKTFNPFFYGAFALHDVPLLNGEYLNVWIEFNAKLVTLPGTKSGILDAGINTCIIYDEIPDILLDKYNDIIEASKKLNT
jgi:hypothetical protein